MTTRTRRDMTKPGWLAGLCALALVLPLVSAALAEGTAPDVAAPKPEPETQRSDLLDAATTLEARIVQVLADMDADIAEQEEAALLSGSEASLAQIDVLQERRDALAKKLTEIRALVTALREDP